MSRHRAMCREAKASFVSALESLRIGMPREFYQLLKTYVPPIEIPATTLEDHYT
jgi:hypothetical protein